MGNHMLAIADFNEAIDLDRENPEGYFRRGISKYKHNRFKEAIEDFETAEQKERGVEEQEPDAELLAGIHDGLGQCYHALKNFDRAVSFFDRAIEAMPENTDFLMHRAQCYFDNGIKEQSIADLQRGLKRDRQGILDP